VVYCKCRGNLIEVIVPFTVRESRKSTVIVKAIIPTQTVHKETVYKSSNSLVGKSLTF